ncbi:hypothetical protein [Streptomyces albogriseolus]
MRSAPRRHADMLAGLAFATAGDVFLMLPKVGRSLRRKGFLPAPRRAGLW